MIEITSKREGFRRAGVAHSTKPTLYSEDDFTEEQWAALEAEDNLIIKVVEAEGDDSKAGKPLTKAQLKAAAKKAEQEQTPTPDILDRDK